MIIRKLGMFVWGTLVLASGGFIPVLAEAQQSHGLPVCDSDNGGLILPEGFCALVVADGLEGARHLDVTATGDIYVHVRGSRSREPNPPGGGVVAAFASAPHSVSSSAFRTTTVPVCSFAGTICISLRPARCIGIG